LNALLPRDVWAERVHVMMPGFHPRRSATARRYRYVIGSDDAARSPFRRRYEWALGRAPDMGRLQAAAALLVGSTTSGALRCRGGHLITDAAWRSPSGRRERTGRG
jgi:tRNA pseudouridine38-40 synthase